MSILPINEPLVSVLLPVYNFPNIERTVNSILEQSYNNLELLICDDGSKIKPVIDNYDDKRIKYFENKINMGLGPTLNRLLKLSDKSSKYFVTVEQDDYYKNYFINDSIFFLERNLDFGMVSGLSEFWDGKRVTYLFPGMIAQGFEYPFFKEMFLLNYRKQIKVTQTCMVVRKDIHMKNNLIFSSNYQSLSVDWDYVLRFSLKSKIKGINKVFVRQDRRINRNSLTKKHLLAGTIVRKLLKDFYNEFPHLVSKKDYRYALATQYYNELGNLKFISRIINLIFGILPIDPDLNRFLTRLKKEINYLKWKK